MKRLIRLLKIGGIAVVGLALLLTLTATAFVYMSPELGEDPTVEYQKSFAVLDNYRDGKFQNQVPTTLEMGFGKTLSIMWQFIFGNQPGKQPDAPLPMQKVDPAEIADTGAAITRATWFGHSAIFLEIDGRKIFLDPMLGEYAGPVPLLSPKRYNSELPISIDALPFIDAVIISHDHYDHLDHASIRDLNDKVGRFFVPLGVGSHLRSWGVAADKITELNWWEEAEFNDLKFICAPARHFSGRGLTRNATLWASWIINSGKERFYFSGDSGYGPHFKEIGDRHGPFDFVMMECGQYNELWKGIHMMPEETVQATLDVRGNVLLPIHWGAFSLALHPWREPISRVMAEAERLQVRMATPRIGEPVLLHADVIPASPWW